jgi:hypothetical protein
VAKNRYSGDLGIVPLDFDKESLSYQPKKKSKTKLDDSEKLLDQCFEEFSVEEPRIDYGQTLPRRDAGHKQKSNFAKNKQKVESYLSDILNSNRTR